MGCDIYFEFDKPIELTLQCYTCGKVVEHNDQQWSGNWTWRLRQGTRREMGRAVLV